VFKQSVLPGQIIIGDDGSGNETKEVIASFAKHSPVPLMHVWQPDNGFKLAAIRNKSFVKATGDYIIQTDGDLLLHRHFIKDHLKWARKGCFVSAGRSLLSPDITDTLLNQNHFVYPPLSSVQVAKKFNALRLLPLSAGSYYLNKGASNYKFVLGANMAFWKTDIITVNGYNEAFTGWGKEDNELAVRLQMAGIKLRMLKNAAVVWHLHHKEANKSFNAQNEQQLAKTIQNKTTFAANGLNKYITK
jgi:glycosyltransferase involved in cell wall biosynthesis